MLKRKSFNMFIILFVVIALLGIGYAFLTTTLSINGTTDVDSNTWDIHFENVFVEEDSVSASAPTIDTNKIAVTYSVHLSKPGDFYEFDVDVRNSGTIDGMIESVTSKVNNQPISNLPNYLEYSVKYYDDIDIVNNQLLKAGDVETYKIRIGYKDNINPSDLPSTNQSINLSFEANIAQATSSAVTRTSNYLYTVTYEFLQVGNTIPNNVITYSNYNDATSVFGQPIFIRHIMKNNIITESNIGFIYNGNVHYLKSKAGEYRYNYNKAIAQQTIGVSNCYENSGQTTSYHCSYSNMGLSLSVDGKNDVSSSGGSYLCRQTTTNSDCFEQ